VFSGGAMMPGVETDDIRFKPMEMLEKLVAEGKKLPPVYMCCGKNDKMLYDHNLVLRDELIKAVMDIKWDELDGYEHEWRFWNIEVEKFLDWIPRTDIYANKGKRRI
jgi:enterochelin esterase-like enzyme